MTEQVAPDLWQRRMRRGEFEAAWTISDRALGSVASPPNQNAPRHWRCFWDGSPLDGKRVLLRCHRGLGDAVQFVRYAPQVRAVAAEVIVWAPAKLLPLLGTVRGVDRLLPLHDREPDVDRDLDIEMSELPHVFRTTLDTIPRDTPYLHIDPTPIPRAGPLAVGLVWRAGEWAPSRSIPFSLMAPLLEIPGIDWRIHQYGPGLDEWRPGCGTLVAGGDLWEEARLMRTLDLMITVDSLPAHLAGALGVPVWLLLMHHADWRWLEERCDSPWYPTMRLFRQPRPNDWPAVIAAAAHELRLLSEANGFPRRSNRV